MHYPGTPQNHLARLLLMFTAIELVVAGIFYSYYGYFVVGQSKSIAAAEGKSGVMWATFFLSLFLFGVAAFTSLVIKKMSNRCITIIYTFLLMCCLLIFGAFSVGGPMARDAVAQEFDSQCKNVSSDIFKVDALYGIGNAQLCGPSCACAADPKLWNEYSAPKNDQKASTTQNVLNAGTSTATSATSQVNNGIVYSATGAHNFPECKGISTTLQLFITANISNSGDELKLGISVLDGVERDFNCAGFCINSKFFTFSEVSQGPPPQTCVKAINQAMDGLARVTMFSGLVYFVSTLIGVVIAFMLICSRFDPKGHHFNELNES
ncbi:tetraspanin family protein [Stylonychia lemnae]|uniref:Tetraspanin family protein n=1 Tax=Stylonychia lemnae TaxID=5949 RepID=A0A078AGH1_STYLE|nr:tetraspanin family protein [Stylonychia lemnae]|eukprot:CDW80637.1 tetraspanin family protein [Stylonychia lemnae]